MNSSILRIVRLSFVEEEIATFIKIFNESQPKIEAFEGCISVQLKKDYHHNNIFYTISHWENHEALDKYRESELFKTTWTKTKALFNDKPQVFSLK